MSPNHSSESPSHWRSQLIVTCSSSVAAGQLFHSMPLTFNAAVSISPRMPGPDPVMEKYAWNRG